jgi:hypothetical protein
MELDNFQRRSSNAESLLYRAYILAPAASASP